MNTENILELNGVSKSYRDFSLQNVSFQLPKGSIMGLVGANGAGKSTTIKSILNLIRRDSGDIKVFGLDNLQYEQEIKERLGIVFDETYFHGVLKPKQINKFMKDIYKAWDEEQYFGFLKKLKIPLDKQIKDFSRGLKMKLSIAAAMSHGADLLILDEPTGGLDPVVRNEILDLFLDFIQDENRGILLSSHIITDLEKIADYITFLDNGKVVLSESKDEILYLYGVLKGSLDDLNRVEKWDLICDHKHRFGLEAHIKHADQIRAKYPGLVVDPVNIEDMMLFIAKEGQE